MTDQARTYGGFRSIPEDPTRCVEGVCESGRGVSVYQCQKKRGHGKGGLYCTTHGKQYPVYPPPPALSPLAEAVRKARGTGEPPSKPVKFACGHNTEDAAIEAEGWCGMIDELESGD